MSTRHHGLVVAFGALGLVLCANLIIAAAEEPPIRAIPGVRVYSLPEPDGRSDTRTAMTRAGQIYVGGGKHLWKSVDKGRTWTRGKLPHATAGGFGILADDTFLLVYDEPGYGTSVIRSVDHGETWSRPFRLDIGPYDQSGGGWAHVYQCPDSTAMITVTLRHGKKWKIWDAPMVCGIRDHIYRSTDGGKTWGDRTLLSVHAAESSLLALRGSGRMLVFIRHQRSHLPDDPDDLWTRTGAPEGNPYVCKNGMIAESDDGGRTWRNHRIFDIYGSVPGELIQPPDNRVAAVWLQRYPHEDAEIRVRISADGGRNWGKRTYRLMKGNGYPSSVVCPDGTIVTVCENTKMTPAGQPKGPRTMAAARWKLPADQKVVRRGLIINQSADAMFDAGVLPFPLDESTSKEEIIQGYKKLMDRYVDTQVSDVFLNVNFQRVCYQSEVWDSYWDNDDPETTTGWPRRSWLVHKKGVDPYAVCINHCRENGISPWISMRMNDTHYVNDRGKANTFWLKHPEYRRSSGGGFDYGIKEVRDHHLDLIRELLGRYDADGLELDWMRFPHHFKPGREKQGCEVLTEFTRQVRKLTGQWSARRGHPIQLAARVPAVPETAIGLGLDGVTWVQQRLIDVLIPTSTWKPTDTDIPIELWRQCIGPAACAGTTLAAGTDIWVQGYPGGVQMRDNLESMRGFTAAMLDRGADQIYLFNHFNAENDFKHTFKLPDGSTIVRDEYRRLLSQAARLETVLDKSRRHVVTFRDTAPPGASNPKQLPAVLTAKGKPARFRIYTGPKPSSGRVVIRAGLDDRPNVAQARLTARINAADCGPIADLNKPDQFIPHTKPGAHVVWSVEELARRVVQFEVPLAAVKRGRNLFELSLDEGGDQKITWLEIYVVP